MLRISSFLSGRLFRKILMIGGLLGASSIVIGITVEWISRGSLQETLSWLNGNKAKFALNVLIEASAVALLYSLIGSLFLSIGAAALLMSVVAFINYYKSKLVGEPFFPWDIVQRKEGMDVGPLFTGGGDLMRVWLILLVLVGLLVLHVKLGKKFRVSWISRIVMGCTAVAVLLSFSLQVSWAKERIVSAGVDETIWSQQVNYDSNGLMLAFTLNVQHSFIEKPESYSEEAIAGISDQIPAIRGEAAAVLGGQSGSLQQQKPNVIFVMSESFWDPTVLPNVTFSRDPIPTVHELQQQGRTRLMLSPQFGGGTSNVEFEALTGFSMSLLPAGSVPYLQYINKPTPSLAGYFAGQGYKSLAIHSYEGWFWKRDEVYKQLGFAEFKSKDQFVDPVYKGPYIADTEVAQSIIDATEKADEPVFIYAVTMQNHAPYTDPERYGENGNTIKVEGSLTDEAKDMLETYSQGAYDADQSLKMLIDYYAQSDEPTYIMFYGDHLPTLGLEYDLYRQAGLIRSANPDEWSLQELKQLRSTPLATWANFPIHEEPVDTLSSAFLGSYAMNAAGLTPTGQFAFNSVFYRQTPGLIRNLVLDQDQQMSHEMNQEQAVMEEQYKLLQYDLLFGNQFAAGGTAISD